MKRTIIGLTAATLMGGGLVGISADTASAVCPYTGCVPTATTVRVVNAPIHRGDQAKICIRVRTAGNGQPRGHVKVAVVRNNGGFRWFNARRYDGGRSCFVTPALHKRGKYIVRGGYEAAARSAFDDSDNITAMFVRRRR
jgi:hypothetical protein